MAVSTKTCYLFTQSFPYGTGEIFIEKEIPFLSAYFDKVIIFPLEKGHGDCVKLPLNVSCELLFDGNYKYNRKAILPRNSILLIGLMIKEFFYHPFNTLLDFRNSLSDLLHQSSRAISFQYYLKNKNNENVVMYSFWFDRWALILALAKKINGGVSLQFFSRAHGFEIFKDQTKFGYHPFKWFMLKEVNKVYTVSKHGRNYLANNFQKFRNKINFSYLGTTDGIITQRSENLFHIVSCAHVRGIKRLDRVCDILKYLPSEFHVKWTLLGDGEDLELIKQKAKYLKSNVTCVFVGHLMPKQLLQFYSNETVSLFLSVSKSEGLPYTMMEAISFGIPIMATDVGGCKEIVTEQTGILIEKDFNPQIVADKIVEFSKSYKNTIEFRKGVRAFWEENFSAEKNYFDFYKRINN